MRHVLLLIITLLTGSFLSGCATVDSVESQVSTSVSSLESSAEAQLKAPPSQGAGFVPVQEMAKRSDLPFDKSWIKQGVDWNRFWTIYITKVHKDYLIQAD
jgi:uncharacterized protein YceK